MRRFYIFFLVLLALSSSINTVNAAVVNVPDDRFSGCAAGDSQLSGE